MPGRPDGLLRPAAELAVELARQGRAADPPLLVPRRVLPFLRFTRLPDAALTVVRRVLDDDEDFRALVRDATSESLVGKPSWLFLDRPPGWEEELDALARRKATAEVEQAVDSQADSDAVRCLAIAEEARRRAEAEVGRLRAALGASKERLAVEIRARRLGDSERGRLRQRVSELEAVATTEAGTDVPDSRRAAPTIDRHPVGDQAVEVEPVPPPSAAT